MNKSKDPLQIVQIWFSSSFPLSSYAYSHGLEALIDEKKITIGMLAQPNQKPIADNNFASPSPIPSLFLIFLYKNIIDQIIK